MRAAMIVPGGVDESGSRRIIPALVWLIRRIAERTELHVFSMRGTAMSGSRRFHDATVHDVGGNGRRSVRTFRAIMAQHRARPFDLVHAFWASGPGVPAGLAARVLRLPLLLHVTGGDLVAMPDIGYGGRVGLGGRTRVSFALASADRLTVPSRAIERDLAQLGYTAARLPLGVDLDEWRPAPPRPREAGRPVRLLHVASLNPVKDQCTLLRAARHLTDSGVDFVLDLVGEDTMHGRVQSVARELSLANVHFHGFLEQGVLRPLVEHADLLVMSSLHEADPVVALEAAALGVPTVGTRRGHISDWAPEAALGVEPGDDEALADAITTLIDDDARRIELARNAQARALGEDADWSADRVFDLYGELTRSAA